MPTPVIGVIVMTPAHAATWQFRNERPNHEATEVDIRACFADI